MSTYRADMAREFGDPENDNDSFEKSLIRAIDALDQLSIHFDSIAIEAEAGETNATPEGARHLRDLEKRVTALRNEFQDINLGIPQHWVLKNG